MVFIRKNRITALIASFPFPVQCQCMGAWKKLLRAEKKDVESFKEIGVTVLAEGEENGPTTPKKTSISCLYNARKQIRVKPSVIKFRAWNICDNNSPPWIIAF